MNTSTVKPKFGNKTDFSRVLQDRANEYFRNLTPTGDWRIYFKLLFIPVHAFLLILCCASSSPPVIYTAWILMGFTIPGIGFNLMHDAGHGSFSKKKWVNDLVSYSGNFVGVLIYYWKSKHNVQHHMYTNIEHHDEDIDLYPMLRTHKDQKWLPMHRFQYIYCWFLYPLQSIFWIFGSDFKRYFTGTVAGVKKKLPLQEHVVFWVTKLWHVGVYICLPIYFTGMIGLYGYLIAMGISGLILGAVFQCAHVVEMIPIKKVENLDEKTDWNLHQIETTANFAPDNKLLSWYIGGLNYQIEHHLFHRVAHVHYPLLSEKVVKPTCDQYGIPYLQFSTFRQALASHVRNLKVLGNP